VKPLEGENEINALIVGGLELGTVISEAQAECLLGFLDRFYAWNPFGGFTRIPREEGVRLHLHDSLSIVGDLAGAQSIADLGTGGGMPGIPLAIVLRDVEFTLVEARGRRCSFLREIVRDFGLAPRVQIVEGDARSLASGPTRFDAVVARAFLPPTDLLALGCQLITRAGRVLVMASSDEWLRDAPPGEISSRLGIWLRYERSLTLPHGTELRRIFRFERPA